MKWKLHLLRSAVSSNVYLIIWLVLSLSDSCLLWSATSMLINKSVLHHDIWKWGTKSPLIQTPAVWMKKGVILQLDDTSRMSYAMSKEGFPNIYHHSMVTILVLFYQFLFLSMDRCSSYPFSCHLFNRKWSNWSQRL